MQIYVMERVYTLDEWDRRYQARQDVVRRFGVVRRTELNRDLRKSRHKRHLLEQTYGSYGQPERSEKTTH